MNERSFDYALEAFEEKPSASTAAALLTEAMTYWHDDMIGDDTYDRAVTLVRDWLVTQ